jgi:hypothetical protein
MGCEALSVELIIEKRERADRGMTIIVSAAAAQLARSLHIGFAIVDVLPCHINVRPVT